MPTKILKLGFCGVRSQGNLGSCTAFAAAAVMEYIRNRTEGWYDKRNKSGKWLSTMYVYYNNRRDAEHSYALTKEQFRRGASAPDSKECPYHRLIHPLDADTGSGSEPTKLSIEQYGACEERDYSYIDYDNGQNDWRLRPFRGFEDETIGFRKYLGHFDEKWGKQPPNNLIPRSKTFYDTYIREVEVFRSSADGLLDRIRDEILANELPVSIGIDTPQAFRDAKRKRYYDLSDNSDLGGHQIVAMGYTDRLPVRDLSGKIKKVEAFYIRNSWTVDEWGINDYIWVSRDALKRMIQSSILIFKNKNAFKPWPYKRATPPPPPPPPPHVDPIVNNIGPAAGQNDRETPVVIVGKNFIGARRVRLMPGNHALLGSLGVAYNFPPGMAAPDDNIITGLSVPAGLQPGDYDVIVTTLGGENATSRVKFRVVLPGTPTPTPPTPTPTPGPVPIRPAPQPNPPQREFLYMWFLFDTPEYYNHCRNNHSSAQQGMGAHLHTAEANRRIGFADGPFDSGLFSNRILGLGAVRRTNPNHWVWCYWDHRRGRPDYGDHVGSAPTPPTQPTPPQVQADALRHAVDILVRTDADRKKTGEELKRRRFDLNTRLHFRTPEIEAKIKDIVALLSNLLEQNREMVRAFSMIHAVFTADRQLQALYEDEQKDLRNLLSAVYVFSNYMAQVLQAYQQGATAILDRIDVPQLNNSLDAIDRNLQTDSQKLARLFEALASLLRTR